MARSKLPRRPGDTVQRAMLIGDLATGSITQDDIDKLPPMGRELSARARTEKLSAERRKEIATIASKAAHAQ